MGGSRADQRSERRLVVRPRALHRGDLPTAQESINLAGLDITKMSLSERFALRDRIKAEIARERQRRRLNKGNYRHGLQVRFT